MAVVVVVAVVVCRNVCACAFVYMCMCYFSLKVCGCVGSYMTGSVCMSVCARVCACVHLQTCVRACARTCHQEFATGGAHIYIYTCTDTYVASAHTEPRTHTCTHTHTLHTLHLHPHIHIHKTHLPAHTLSSSLMCTQTHIYLIYVQPPRTARRHIRATPTSRTETHTSNPHEPHGDTYEQAPRAAPAIRRARRHPSPASLHCLAHPGSPLARACPLVGRSAERRGVERVASERGEKTCGDQCPAHTHPPTHARKHTKNV
jgi:hypothetical protein